MTTYTKTDVNDAVSAKANQSTTYTKIEVHDALSAKASQLSTYTTEVDDALADKLSKLTAGDPANPLGAPIATRLQILTGSLFIHCLVVHLLFTVSNSV